MQIVFTGILYGHYKGLPSFNNILCASFFLVCFISSHTFRGLAGACVNRGSFYLIVHSLVCPIIHSYLDGFQPNLVQHFPHVFFCSGPNGTPFHPHISTEEEVILNFGSNRGSSFEKIKPTEKTPTRTYRSCKPGSSNIISSQVAFSNSEINSNRNTWTTSS